MEFETPVVQDIMGTLYRVFAVVYLKPRENHYVAVFHNGELRLFIRRDTYKSRIEQTDRAP